MKRLTHVQERWIRRRVEFLCSKQTREEHSVFGPEEAGNRDVRLFGRVIEVERGSTGFEHIRDIIIYMLRRASI